MISFLHGILHAKTAQYALIEVGGIGFQLWMPTSSLSQLGAPGAEVFALTSLQIRENEITLFGFLTEEERSLFEKLITVSGIGPKIAIASLSTYGTAMLAGFIAHGDCSALAKVPGLGKKTAQRIVLELRPAFEKMEESLLDMGRDEKDRDTAGAATDVLYAMGFTPQEVEKACKGYHGDRGDVDALVRYALKRLGQTA